MSIHKTRRNHRLRAMRRISEARAFANRRKFIREDVETDIPESDEVTITLSKEDIEILKSILAKAGTCEDCDDDEEAEVEPESDEVDIVDVDMEPSPEADDSAYYA